MEKEKETENTVGFVLFVMNFISFFQYDNRELLF